MSLKKLSLLIAFSVVVATSIGVAQQQQDQVEIPISKLIAERDRLLRDRADHAKAQYPSGGASLDSVILSERELLHSQLDSATTVMERIAIRESQLKIAAEREKLVEKLIADGLRPLSDLTAAKVDRLAAQISFLQEKSHALRPSVPVSEIGRYQFERSNGGNVFVLDTITGRVWQRFVDPSSGSTEWSENKAPWVESSGK